MVRKIYLDMDGVIANFEKRYFERYNEMPGTSRDRKEWSNNWTDFVTTRQFETLEYWPEAEQLLEYLAEVNKKVPIEILTSSGGPKYHDLVAEQKVIWLCNKGIPYKPNVVPGRARKSSWAEPDFVLIDDTADVIEGWVRKGGTGILYRNFDDCRKMLEFFLTDRIYT